MTISISKTQQKRENTKRKRLVKKLVKEWQIQLKDIVTKSGYHRSTVIRALDSEDKYWSDPIITAALELVEERKNASSL